jgi:hypothetical protein
MNTEKSGFIYAIKDESSRVKLGMADNVDKRLRELQTGNAEVLTIMYLWPVDNMRKAEAAVHTIFSAYRIRGEWFRLDHTVEKLLAKIFRVTPMTDKEERNIKLLGL